MKLKIDPRYFLILNHSFLLVFGLFVTTLQRDPLQIAFGIGMTILAEIFLSVVFKKNKIRSWFDIIKSSLVISLGLLILLISRHWWFYGVAGVFAVSAKYFFRKDSENHIYNPTGFAIIAMLTFFPNYLFVRGDQFNGTLVPLLSVLFFGLNAIILSNRWRLTLSYISTSLVLSLLYCGLTQHRFLLLFGPDVGTSGLLFMFLMFTDPKTSPSNYKKQIFQGISIAFLNLTFRLLEFAYPQFVALFLFSSFEAIVYFLIDRLQGFFKTMVEYLRRAFWSKTARYTLIAVIIGCHLVPIATRTVYFPFSDYKMFTEKRSEADLYSYIPAIKTESGYQFIPPARSFLSLSFVLKSIFEKNKFEDLGQYLDLFAKSYKKENPDQLFDTVYLIKVSALENEFDVHRLPQEVVYTYRTNKDTFRD